MASRRTPLSRLDRVLLVLAWLMVACAATAQTPYYARTDVAFGWIDPSSHATAVFTGGAACAPGSFFNLPQDDDITAQIPIGFTFNFGGTDYTQLQIQSNGRLQFNNAFCGFGTLSMTPPRTYPYPFPDPNLPRAMRVYGTDVVLGPGGGSIRYATLGTAPNRRFVVTWFNVIEYAAPTSLMNFQVILYEGSNEFVYQFKDILNPTLGRAQIGWQLTTTDFDTVPIGGIGTLAYTAVRFYPSPGRIAHYRFDEAAWSAAASQVLDSSGNARHGQAFNGATTADGARAYTSTADGSATCRYGAFDGVNDYVALASFPDLNAAFTSSGFTITAWIRTRDRTKPGQRILIDDEGSPGAAEGWGFSLADGGPGIVRFFSRSTNPIILDTPAVVQNNAWYFVAAVADFGASRKTIYVYDQAGALVAQASHAYTGAWVSHAGTASIGGETDAAVGENTAAFRFNGDIDEVRVLRGPVAQSVLEAILRETRGCAEPLTPLGAFNAFEATVPAGSITGVIKTKIAGRTFAQSTGNIAIVALTADRTAVDASITGAARVELLDASGGGPVDANGCSATDAWPVIQTIGNVTFQKQNAGRLLVSPSPTEDRAWRVVRVRVSQPPGNPKLIGCSADAFSIRPDRLLVSSATDTDALTAGTARALANVAASGGNVHRAGRPFTLQASAVNGAGTAIDNYTGTPVIFGTSLRLPDPAACAGCVPGAFASGAWTNTAGVLRTDTASYSEAGALAIELEDRTWAAIDLPDSNATERFVPSGAPLAIGRFVPDTFAVSFLATPTFRTFGASDAACNATGSPRRSFTYVGQPFDLTAPLSLRVEARNAAGGVTTNYRGALWKLGAGVLAQNASCAGADPNCTFTATHTAGGTAASIVRNYAYTTSPVLNPGWDATLAGGAAPTVTSNENGTGQIAFAAADRLALARPGPAPLAPFTAGIALTVTVADAAEAAIAGNGTITTSMPASASPVAFDAGNTFRYGRLRLVDGTGPVTAALAIPMETQFWNGIGFTTNTDDHCTTIAIGSIGLGNFRERLSLGETSASLAAGPFLAGAKAITLSAPGSGNDGTVELAVNLGASAAESLCGTDFFTTAGAGQPWLRGRWCGAAHDRDPVARATFGDPRARGPFIFRRENY